MNDLPAEHELRGGNVTVEVVRVGDTVRRTATRWSSSVDALLEHLHMVGFGGAPRPLGYDDAGRQRVALIDGYVGPDPSDLDVDRLRDVGQLIRRLHDATSTFVAPRDAVWNVAIAPDREELIGHHDASRAPTACLSATARFPCRQYGEEYRVGPIEKDRWMARSVGLSLVWSIGRDVSSH